MKKVKSSILALVLIAGIGGAFATKTATASAKRSSYNWKVFNRQGVQTGTLSNETESQAETSTGCSTGTPTVCAVATGGPTIYYPN